VSSSIFPNILPGFRNDKFIFSSLKNSKEVCDWASVDLLWGSIANNGSTFDDEVIESAIKGLNLSTKNKVTFPNRKELLRGFLEGKCAFFFFGSGFWAQDVLGDLQMVFTPNLHEPLFYANKSKVLRSSLIALENIPESEVDNKLADFNTLINNEGLVNPVLHTRRFYAAVDSEKIRDLPQAVSAPAPWQIINVESE
jgi:hypothetical protein